MPEEKKFICEFCGKEFKNAGGFATHKRICNKNTDKDIYTCEYCGKQSANHGSIILHQKQCDLNPLKQKLNINRQKTELCEYCGKLFTKPNINQHKNSCLKNQESKRNAYHLDHGDLICKFCSKECKNKNSLVQHEIRCKENPDRINVIVDGFNNKGHECWNNGLTKETDDRLKSMGEKISNSLIGKPGRQHTEEEKQVLRESALKNELGGFNGRKGIQYNDVKLDSSYEVQLAKDLDNNNISWIRPKRIKYYDLDNKLHYYIPDFYLPDYDIYLDPKNDFLIENINPSLGYKDVDKIKWVCEQNNVKIFILNKEQLSWEYVRTLV